MEHVTSFPIEQRNCFFHRIGGHGRCYGMMLVAEYSRFEDFERYKDALRAVRSKYSVISMGSKFYF